MSYGKIPYVDLKAIILSKVSEEELFRQYVKADFIIDKPFSSPFRRDSSPSCTITSFRNRLKFKDFGNGDYDGDIFTVVGKIYNINYGEVLNKIYNDFNMKTLPIKPELIKSDNYVESIPIETRIYPTIRKWYIRDRDYWKTFDISLKELSDMNIFPLESFKVINKTGEYDFEVNDLYVYGLKNDDTHWKVLQSFNKKCKWISNIPNNTVEKYTGLDRKILVITKSRKDKIILDKLIDCDKWILQSEKIPLSNEDIIEINKSYELVIVCLDNDATGLKYSNILEEQINNSFAVRNITSLLEHNDPAEYSKNKQLIRLKNVLDEIIQEFDFLPF